MTESLHFWINDFLMTRPNIAGFQSFHNTGGMILRGPGMAWRRSGAFQSDDPTIFQMDLRVQLELELEDLIVQYGLLNRGQIIMKLLYQIA